jgi:hypothetical protein
MAKITGWAVGKEFCEILGLDPSKVQTINIVIDTDSALHADVTMFIEKDQVGKIKEIIKQFAWKKDELDVK